MRKAKNPLIIITAIFVFLIIIPFTSATSLVNFSDQGTDVRISSTYELVPLGTLEIYIYDSPTAGNLIYQKEFTDAIVNGSWNVIIDNFPSDFGKTYYKDYAINGDNLNFDGEDRLAFMSPLGDINITSDINLGQKITFLFGDAIENIVNGWLRLTGNLNVTQDLAVGGNVAISGNSLKVSNTEVCLKDGTNCQSSAGVIAGEPYLYRDSSTIYINETKLNNTIIIEGNRLGFNFTSNETELVNSLNNSKANSGNCPVGQVVMNTTNSGVQCIVMSSSEGNSSWNESRANGLYYSIANPSNFFNATNYQSYNSTYAGYSFGSRNETLDTYNNWNAVWLSTYNSSYLTTSYNSTYAANIGNASWNESLAHTLFDSTYNSTYAGYSFGSRNETLDTYNNWNAVWLSTYNSSYLTTSYNSTYAANIGNASWNESLAHTLFDSTYNSSYAGYATNVSRNWTLDAYNAWNAVWSSTYNSSYNSFNTTLNIQQLYNTTASMIANLSAGQYLTATNISISQIANISINQYLTGANASYLSTYNSSYLTTSYNSTYAGYSFGSRNETLDTYNNWNAAWLSTYNSSYLTTSYNSTYAANIVNASWNESLAHTLFDSTYNATYAGYVQGNLSFNQSLTDSLYAAISVTGDNSSWNESRANGLYYGISNPSNFFNATNYQSYNSTYAGYATNVSRNWTLDAYNAWNAVWSSTYNSSYLTSSYNSTYAANIVNASWNESLTNNLYISSSKQKEFYNLLSTGLISGGNLTIASATTFNLEAGTGIIVNNYGDPTNPIVKEISWEDKNGVNATEIANAETTYIYIDSLGNVVQEVDSPTPETKKDYILIGWIDHSDKASIDFALTEPYYITDVLTQATDFFDAFGSFNIEGNEYSSYDSNLKLNRSSGTTFEVGSNYINSKKNPNRLVTEAESGLSFVYYNRNGSGGWVNDNNAVTDIDPNYYDGGSGTPVTVPSGNWTIQLISFYAPMGITDVQYGQEIYNSLNEAEANINSPIEINPYNSFDTQRAYLIVKQGATSLSNSSEAKFITIGKFGQPATTGAPSTGGGESNTASNVGLYGVGFYLQKVGPDLQFKNLRATSQIISITENPINKTVDIGIVLSELFSGSYNYTQIINLINTTLNLQTLYNSTANQIANLSINQYLTSANASYLSTYNSTYASYATNVSRNWTLDTYNTWNAAWSSTYNSSYLTSSYNATYAANIGNASWNESLAHTLFDSTYNSTYASYATNVSRNWTLDTYNTWNAAWSSTYNSSYLTSSYNATYAANIGNASWNESLAHTLFDSTYNSTYAGYATNVSRNWTLDTYNAWNAVWLSTYNSSYLTTSYNATYAANIGNASWNESLAHTLFDSTYNSTYAGYATNVSRNWTLDTYNTWNAAWSSTYNSSYLTSSYNATYAANIGNASWNESLAHTLFDSTYNASYAGYATNVSRNWTLDTYNTWNAAWSSTYNSSYLTSSYNSTYAANIGNASWNESLAHTLFDSTYNSSYAGYQTFNQTSFISNLTTTDCGAGTLVIGIGTNGTVLCATDLGGGTGITSYANIALTNQSQTLTGNQTIIGNVTLSGAGYWFVGLFNIFEDAFGLGSSIKEIQFNGSTLSFNQTFNNQTIGMIANNSINQYLTNANDSYLSIYNTTYAGYQTFNQTSLLSNLTATDCAAGTLVIGVNSNGTVLCATDASGGAAAARNMYYTTGAKTTNSTVITYTTLFTIPILANTNYTLDCNLLVSANVTTTGVRFNMTLPAIPIWQTTAYTHATTTAVPFYSSCDGAVLTCNDLAITSLLYPATGSVQMHSYIENGGTAGNILFQFASEIVNTKASVHRGSYCELKTV